VLVTDNTFNFGPATAGASCTAAIGCGFNGLFSQYGTFPSWSPYQATVVEQHIMQGQNNHFSVNTYTGPWQFMAGELGTIVSWGQWLASYGQDVGSLLGA
jgi:hypothetical protein